MKAGNIILTVIGMIIRAAVLVFAVYGIYRGALLSYDYGYRIFTEPPLSSEESNTITVAITKDMSAAEIGQLLKNKGLIRDANLFVLQYYLSEHLKDVKPGVFELSKSMTVEEMMAVMAVSSEEDAAEQKTGKQETP